MKIQNYNTKTPFSSNQNKALKEIVLTVTCKTIKKHMRRDFNNSGDKTGPGDGNAAQ